MNIPEPEIMSEESEDDGGESREEMIYRRKYQMLLERCEVLQQDNERLVHRIQEVYKYTRQVRKERKFLMDRLDNYGDNWRQGILQYFYEDAAQYTKPVAGGKVKHQSHSEKERIGKRVSGGTKRIAKDKTESDTYSKKQTKDQRSASKNYNFM